MTVHVANIQKVTVGHVKGFRQICKCDHNRFFLKPCPSPACWRILMQKLNQTFQSHWHSARFKTKQKRNMSSGRLSQPPRFPFLAGRTPGLLQPETLVLTFLPCNFRIPVNLLVCLFSVPHLACLSWSVPNVSFVRNLRAPAAPAAAPLPGISRVSFLV